MGFTMEKKIITVQYPHSYSAKIHPKSPSAMDFCTPESLSYGQRSKCADLLNSYKNSYFLIVLLYFIRRV